LSSESVSDLHERHKQAGLHLGVGAFMGGGTHEGTIVVITTVVKPKIKVERAFEPHK
jgi:hypothetical protein